MLGDKVREARKSRGITLEKMAEASGLTASYLSQLERNLTEPSISSLRKLSQVLQMPMSSFLDDDFPQAFVIKSDKRRSLKLKDSAINYEYLSPISFGSGERPSLEVVEFSLKPGKWTNEEHLRHNVAEECIIVLDGSMTVDCIDAKYILEKGDSLYLRANTPHNIFNHTENVATAIFCATPPVL